MRAGLKLLAALSVAFALPTAAQERLFTLGPEAQARGPIVNELRVTLFPQALTPGREQVVVLPMPDGDMPVRLRPVPPRELQLKEGQAAWTGMSDDGAEVFVMRLGQAIEAQIQRRDRAYRLRSLEGRNGVLEVIDATRFREAPNDGVILEREKRRGDVRPQADSLCMDSADRIDLLVLYTPAARDAAGGVAQIENEIAFAVGRTNLAYANSNVFHRLNLVSTQVASFTEPPGGVDSNALLGLLQGPSDMTLDAIHGTRDAARADLVSLIYETDNAGWCGWGYTTENANADTTDNQGFVVVQRTCAGVNLSLAHEVGHNLGALHNRENNSGTSAHGYNFGHIQLNPSMTGVSPWRTVMSYNTPCTNAGSSCQRVPWFSNPGVSRFGDPTGVPTGTTNPEHNVMVFALNDAQVSRYRCARTGEAVANVWMKDRWNDTGLEPDPATAGEAMWQSPYIWVRLAEDSTLEHAHEHENPVAGQSAHVYVKQHNTGGTAEAGTLELYFANASTNLNDPSSWTQIGTVAKTVAIGVDVSHFVWSSLPGPGHFCLLVRWNTDGSPLSFSNLDGFVRGDNDVVWRNVNIVPLGGNQETENVLVVGGDERSPATFLAIEARPLNQSLLPWNEMVRLELALDPRVLGDRVMSDGIEPLGDGRFRILQGARVGVLGPIHLRPAEQARAVVRVREQPELVRKVRSGISNPAGFEITISQVRPEALPLISNGLGAAFEKGQLVLGGVTYTLQLLP
jgi:hypothetical protein